MTSYSTVIPNKHRKCVEKRDFLGTLLVTWRQREEFLSPAHPAHSAHPAHPRTEMFLSLFWQVRTFHSVWYVRHCTASTVVPKYAPHLVVTEYDCFVFLAVWSHTNGKIFAITGKVGIQIFRCTAMTSKLFILSECLRTVWVFTYCVSVYVQCEWCYRSGPFGGSRRDRTCSKHGSNRWTLHYCRWAGVEPDHWAMEEPYY